MMRPDCPPRGVLHQYSLGDLTDSEAEQVAAHLEDCATCMASLNDLSAQPDSLISALKKGTNSHKLSSSSGPGNSILVEEVPLGSELNGYCLKEELGHGGMGKVYRAGHPRLEQEVALKVMKPGQNSPQLSIRFEAERQTLALMNHPNIARVLDGGLTTDGRPYLVMELIQGLALHKYCDKFRLGVSSRLELFIQVCHAVQHAHQKGIIHRDLKPSNVLVTEIDDKPVPKVIDFGVAKAMDHHHQGMETQVGMVIGTPEYMSPEQASLSNKDIDTRSDVYSLGVMLYELLTGVTPFRQKPSGTTPVLEIFRAIREDDAPAPSSRLGTVETVAEIAAHRSTEPGRLVKNIRGELDWIVLKCLEKKPTDRYSSATALAEDVHRYLHNDPVSASPPSMIYRMRKFVGRNRIAVLGGVATLAALLIGSILTTVGFFQANQAKDAAEKDRDEKAKLLLKLDEEKKATERALQLEKATRKQAILAMRSLTDRFVFYQIGQQPQLTEKDKLFYQKIIDIYQAYFKVRDEDEESQFMLTEAYLETGKIRKWLGEHAAAIEHFTEGRKVAEKLIKSFPDSRQHRRKLVQILHQLGTTRPFLSQFQEAEQDIALALNLSQKLMREKPENESRDLLVDAYYAQSQALRRRGEFDESMQVVRKGIAEAESSLKNGCTETMTLHVMLSSLSDQAGNLLNLQKKHDDAEAYYLKAITNLDKLVARDKNDPGYEMQVYRILIDQGTNYKDWKKYPEAEVALHKALDGLRILSAKFPLIFLYRTDLATAENNLGLLYLDMRRYHEAETHLLASLKCREQMAAEFPLELAVSVNLAGVKCNIGKLQYETGHTEGSLPYFESAIEILNDVLKKQPNFATATDFLFNCQIQRATALMKLERWEASVQAWEKCIELQSNTEFYAVRRAQCLVNYNPKEAVEEVTRLSQSPKFNSNYASAMILCIASKKLASSQSEKLHADAVTMLHKLIPKKYFQNPENLKRFLDDPRFAPLRDREDYKKLLAAISQ